MSTFDEPITRRSALRFIAFGAVAAGAIGLDAVRLAYMQLTQAGQVSNNVAPGPTTTTTETASVRGLIRDRSGRLIVMNQPQWAVKIRPADLPFSERSQVVDELARVLKMPAATIQETIDSAPGSTFDLVRIATGVPDDVARLLTEEQANLPGVDVAVEAQRQYIDGPLFSQIVGYSGPIDASELTNLQAHGYLPDDYIGKTGVEAVYETELRGTYGTQIVQRDPTGQPIATFGGTAPQPGYSLRLTVDTREQQLAQQALEWGIATAHLVEGVVIVMNPQTGEVLAMVSLPTYDNNKFAGGISSADYNHLLTADGRPLVNHAIGDQYPPGSTYKLVTGTGALADGKITPTTLVQTKPFLTIGAYRYPDWNHAGFGDINIDLGFGNSSDTFFYQLAAMLGIDRLGYWGRQYGFGAPTNIDLPSEAMGIVPTNKWKFETLGQLIFPGEVFYAGIGQGYDAVTPIQLLNAYCALANGGTLYQPRLVRDVYTADGNMVKPFQPTVLRKVNVPADVLRTMRQAARTTVTIRHTYNLVDMPIKIAGKTGTAEFSVRDKLGRLPYHHWAALFLPKDPYNGNFDGTDSELAVLAFAYDARTIGNSATEIAKYYLQLHYDIKKDYRLPQLLVQGNFYGQD